MESDLQALLEFMKQLQEQESKDSMLSAIRKIRFIIDRIESKLKEE